MLPSSPRIQQCRHFPNLTLYKAMVKFQIQINLKFAINFWIKKLKILKIMDLKKTMNVSLIWYVFGYKTNSSVPNHVF